MNRFPMFGVASVIALALIGGCGNQANHASDGKMMSDADAQGAVATAKVQPSKAAATQPSNQKVTGTVKIVQMKDGVHFTAQFTGLSPGKHGFHIHEKGDMSDPGLASVGDHYNPGHSHHGDAKGEARHAGDLGNLVASADGTAKYDQMIAGLTVAELIGKSVIVHAQEDDLKTDPSGNSGGRVAGGVIEAAK